jgi:NADPH-dependent ferric siderophore reductase
MLMTGLPAGSAACLSYPFSLELLMYGIVQSVEQLSPGMVRIVLGEGDLSEFEPTGYTDEYINAQFPPAGAPYEPPFSPDDLAELPAEQRPRPRRFTVRSWDGDRQRLTLDFAVHGDTGYAGPWAKRAQPGDRLQFKGPGGGYKPDPSADWHLLVGDESALPAIAASLERIPPGHQALALIVVDGPEYEQPLPAGPGIEVRWLHRRQAKNPEDVLVDEVRSLSFPDGPVDLFVHGEAGEVRAVRKHLLADRGLDVSGQSISAYWRRDHDDEQWRAVKRQWLAEQAADA